MFIESHCDSLNIPEIPQYAFRAVFFRGLVALFCFPTVFAQEARGLLRIHYISPECFHMIPWSNAP